MPLAFISQGRNNSIRQLVKSSNVETNVANTWTITSLIPGLNSRVLNTFSTLNFKAQSPGSSSGAGGISGGCYGIRLQGGRGGSGIAGVFVNTNITKAASMSMYSITLGLGGIFANNYSNNVQAGAPGGGGRITDAQRAGGGTVGAPIIFIGANTFYIPYSGGGGGGGGAGASGNQSVGGTGGNGISGLAANASFYGKSGNGGPPGSAACYQNNYLAGSAQTAIAFTPLSGATYIYPTNTSPPTHGISAWTSNNYGAGSDGQYPLFPIPPGQGPLANTIPAANGSSGIFRLTVSGIRI